jgi:hypothetical protein
MRPRIHLLLRMHSLPQGRVCLSKHGGDTQKISVISLDVFFQNKKNILKTIAVAYAYVMTHRPLLAMAQCIYRYCLAIVGFSVFHVLH